MHQIQQFCYVLGRRSKLDKFQMPYIVTDVEEGRFVLSLFSSKLLDKKIHQLKSIKSSYLVEKAPAYSRGWEK